VNASLADPNCVVVARDTDVANTDVVASIYNSIAGFVPKRRDMHYGILGDPIFRQREVPRMLELGTARADGDVSVPRELANYPARSRTGKQLRVIPN